MLGMAPKESSAKNNKSLAEAVEIEKKYPYLWDNGNWSTSKTVRNVFVMGSGGIGSMITLQHNEFMTGALTPAPEMIPGFVSKQKKSIGPELGTYPYGCMGVLFRTYFRFFCTRRRMSASWDARVRVRVRVHHAHQARRARADSYLQQTSVICTFSSSMHLVFSQ